MSGERLIAGLVALEFSRGSVLVLLSNHIVLWFPGGGGGPDPLFHPLDPRKRKAAIKAHAVSEMVFARLNSRDMALVFLRMLHLTVCLYQPGKRRKHSLLYRSARSLSLEGCHV